MSSLTLKWSTWANQNSEVTKYPLVCISNTWTEHEKEKQDRVEESSEEQESLYGGRRVRVPEQLTDEKGLLHLKRNRFNAETSETDEGIAHDEAPVIRSFLSKVTGESVCANIQAAACRGRVQSGVASGSAPKHALIHRPQKDAY